MLSLDINEKPKEEANIVPALTNGTSSLPEPITISENGSSVETQDKVVILEGLSTVSDHEEWTALSASGQRPKPRYEFWYGSAPHDREVVCLKNNMQIDTVRSLACISAIKYYGKREEALVFPCQRKHPSLPGQGPAFRPWPSPEIESPGSRLGIPRPCRRPPPQAPVRARRPDLPWLQAAAAAPVYIFHEVLIHYYSLSLKSSSPIIEVYGYCNLTVTI